MKRWEEEGVVGGKPNLSCGKKSRNMLQQQ